MDRQLRGLARCVCRKHRRDDRETIEDLAQEIKIRAAQMDAASKYDPTKGTPLDYLGGIADMLGMEKFVRQS
jgi:Sigma-70 region 2